jgi:hypothetical protein
MHKSTIIGLGVIVLIAIIAFVIQHMVKSAIIQEGPVACTMEAKMCPDGSAVGRSGPDCQFAPCPGDSFLDCIAAGYPAMESFPRQCRWLNGTTVAEVLPRDVPTGMTPLDVLQSEAPYACQTDADCVVKNVGNCCGYYPRCVNQDFVADPAGVSEACKREGMSSVCGFEEPTGCACIAGRCQNGALDSTRVPADPTA